MGAAFASPPWEANMFALCAGCTLEAVDDHFLLRSLGGSHSVVGGQSDGAIML